VERKYGTMDQTQNNFSERYLLEAVPNWILSSVPQPQHYPIPSAPPMPSQPQILAENPVDNELEIGRLLEGEQVVQLAFTC
jgi:hypothetical protein